jgi:p-hydroxybenzoate 3-monooxygenase
MRTQVLIVGGGPAGLLLSEMLHSRAIDSVVLERSSRAHVLSRIRAGVLEQTTADVLRAHGLAERMDREGQSHDGMRIVWAGHDGFFIDVASHVGKRFTTSGRRADPGGSVRSNRSSRCHRADRVADVRS